MYSEKTISIPRTVIKINALRWALVSVIFTALSVALPWFAHQFQLAGPTYLPMHFFVFVAALLAGWRVGLTVGLISPLASYLISGMPLIVILPQITFEVAVYGLAAGLLRERYRLNLWVSLIGAMIAGKLALGFAAWIFGAKAGAAATMINAVTLGWPGILIQLAFVVILVKWLNKYLGKEKNDSPQDRIREI